MKRFFVLFSAFLILFLSGCPQQVNVPAMVVTTGVKLDKSEITLYLQGTPNEATLTATVSPANATDKSLKWSSSDEKVAAVSQSGKVTAKGEGTAVITVLTNDAGKKASCTVTVKKEADKTDNTPPVPAIKSDAFFWGEWTRMDNGKSFVVQEDKVVYDSRNYKVNASDSESLSVESLGTFKKESDSVMVCSSIPYFRNGGTNLEYRLRLVGFSSSVNSMRAAGLGLQGIKGSGRSKIYTSYESKAESDANGDIKFKAPTVNDVQTVTIENGSSSVVVSNLQVQNSGDFMGTVALVDAGQYNLKITGVIADSEKHNGYLYGNNAKSYPMTITITNISNVKCTTSVCTITSADSNMTLTSDDNLSGMVISTLPEKGTKTVKLNVSYGSMNEAFVDTGINISIQNPYTSQEWTDYIPLRFYKGTIPVAISAKSPERNANAALNGFIIYPDGNNQFFAINENSSKILYVPTFGKDKEYRMIFSGATVTSELSKSTEMFYTVAAGTKTPKTVETKADAAVLLSYIIYGGDNHSENKSFSVNEAFEAYLSEGEIDYYTIKADTQEFYSPTGSGYYVVSYESEYDTAPDSIILADGKSLTAAQLPELKKEHMVFDGWYDGATKVVAGSYKVGSSVTLKAKWSYKKYPVTYELNGGTNSSQNVSTYTVNDEVTLAAPSRSYCEFVGWYESSNFTGEAVTKIAKGSSGEKKLYAKWTPENYTITYVLDGKGENSAENPVVYNIDSEDIVLKPAASSDYDFGGWYDNSSCTGTPVTKISKGSHGNKTLYARWAAKRNITYVSVHGTQPVAVTVADGTVLSEIYLPQLSDSAYIFMGWYKEETYANKVENGKVTVSADMSLYAKWLKKCTITYVSAYKQPTVLETAEETVLSSKELPVLREKDYILKGWYREAGFATKVNTGDTVTGDMTLYAKWEEYTDGFVYVQGGTFTMGRTSGSGDNDELPIHSVTLSDFYMSPYEMTQKIYKEVMGTNPSYFSSSPASGEVQEERPVEYVSWYDAIYFCNKYSEKMGLTPCYKVNGNSNVSSWNYTPHNGNSISGTITCDFKADGYRLPTEAEWEYAAKGGINKNSYTYSGSDTAGNVAWYTDNSGSKTHQVGKKAANSLGLYDMSGNVWEWCWDWYGTYSSAAQTDPSGAASGSPRVFRGGSWSSAATYVRVAFRGNGYPYNRNNDYGGFRLVRSSSN